MPSAKGLEWTFDTEAERYAALRPGYVDELYADIFDYVHIDSNSSAVEVGIGGGQATEPILKTGCKLLAVEYGENFTNLCRRKFAEYPGFSAVTARFEDFEHASNSCDLVYSASAFHWIDEEIGYKKVYDMLKSGGAFARFANHPYKDKSRPGMHEAVQAAYRKYMPDSKLSDEYSLDKARARAEIAEKYGFTDISYKLYKRVRTFSAKEYTPLLNTYSDHIAIEYDTRMRFYAEIEDAINSLGGQISVFDTIDMELARKP